MIWNRFSEMNAPKDSASVNNYVYLFLTSHDSHVGCVAQIFKLGCRVCLTCHVMLCWILTLTRHYHSYYSFFGSGNI